MTDTNDNLRIAIILGSTRPGRRGASIAEWVQEAAAGRPGAGYQLLDLAEHPLPHFEEPLPPVMGVYSGEHTRAWAETIAGFDAFVVITPEYNRSIPGVLKNAIDHLYTEWNDKAAGVVAYGGDGGARASEHLRQIFGEVKVPVARQHVGLSLHLDFEDFTRFAPRPVAGAQLATMLDEMERWARALRPLRALPAAV